MPLSDASQSPLLKYLFLTYLEGSQALFVKSRLLEAALLHVSTALQSLLAEVDTGMIGM